MIDQRQTDSADTAESSPGSSTGVGASIVRSLKSSLERTKTDTSMTGLYRTSPPVEETAPMPKPKVSTSSHLGSGMKASAAQPRSSQARTAKKPSAAPTTRRQSRRARLRISRVDPWSVMKTSLLFGVAGWIIFIVATYILFTVIGMTGLYEAINSTVSQVFTSPDSATTFDIQQIINTTRATAFAALIGAVNVVIVTALATIFAFLYNLSAIVMGGIEVTMAED